VVRTAIGHTMFVDSIDQHAAETILEGTVALSRKA
jgi:hypothetical protein